MRNSLSLLLLLILLLSTNCLSAQRIAEKRLKEMEKLLQETLLLHQDSDFETSGIKNPHTNESAVLLSHKTTFDFDTRRENKGLKALIAIQTLGTVNPLRQKDLLVLERERRKILLQDNFSVDKYSVLYFRLDEEEDLFDARVIKKNGIVHKVSLFDATKVGFYSEVPSDYLGYTDAPPTKRYQPIFYKVPIPDLEPGDVIEYEFQHLNSQNYIGGKFSEDDFNPVYYLCERDLPVLKQVIEISTVDDFYLGYRSLLGAPEFQETIEKGKHKYRWTDLTRPGISGVSYLNQLASMPSVKFQVVFAKKRAQDLLWFYNNGQANKSLSIHDFTIKGINYWNRIAQFNDNGQGFYYLNHPRGFTVQNKQMKKLGITELPDDEYIKTSYYFLRGRMIWKEWTDYEFSKGFSDFLSKRSIPHQIVITTNKKISSVKDVAFEDEIIWGVRVKDQFYFNPGRHLNPGEIPSYVEGNQCGLIHIEKSKAIEKVDSLLIPILDTAHNKYFVNMTVTPDIVNASLKVQKDVEVTGLSKQSLMDEIMDETPFAETDLRNFGGVGLWEGMTNSEQDKMSEEWEFQKKKWKDDKPQSMKTQAESSYGRPIIQYSSFKINQDGRNHKKPSLKYSETFEIGEMISTVGEDLVIDLPLLIEQQKQVKRDERVRIHSIDAGYARTNSWKINCVIPAGYQFVETANLKQEVKNTAGSFSTSYLLNGNILTIQVSKQYNQGKLPVQFWNQMTSFLDAAYFFSISKIVMKKIK